MSIKQKSVKIEETMKILRIDMGNQSVKWTEVPKKYLTLGGRALTSIMVNDEVPAPQIPLAVRINLFLPRGI